MAVRFTEPFSTYWNHMVHRFAQGDVVPSGEFANWLIATGSPAEEVGDGPAAAGATGRTGRRAQNKG